MKRLYLIGAGLAVVLVVVAKLGPEGAITSTGPLAANHAHLECGECHDNFDSFAKNDKCIGCHDENALTPDELFADSRCVDCHREHRGGDTDLVAIDVAACIGCHPVDTVHAAVPVVLAEKLDAPPADCLRCHGNHDEHRRHLEPRLADARKQLVAAHRAGSPMFHKDACAKCHQDKGTASSLTAASVPGFFDPHVAHVGRLEIRCTWCHTDVDLRQSSGPNARKLADVDRCVQCHQGEYFPAGAEGGS